MSNLSEKLPESRIIQFLEADDEYTVELELLIELGVYSRKDHAVSALKRSFLKDIDFSCSNGKSPNGGRPSDFYLLTSDCFKEMCLMAETEIGRLVRRYYLEVERKWKQKKSAIVAPQTTGEMFLMVAQQMVEQERRTKALEAQVSQLTAARDEAIADLKAVGTPEIEANPLLTRAKVSRLVKDYVGATGVPYPTAWNFVYREFKDRYHIDLKARAKNLPVKFGALDVCEQLGKMEELYAVAFDLLKSN